MPSNEKKLRWVLKGNGMFSLLSGLSLSFFYEPIADLMGVENDAILMYVGIGLVLFSVTVFHAGFRKSLAPKLVWSIIVQDWLWVLASYMIIAVEAWQLTTEGYWWIGVVALIVLDFSIFQYRFLRRREVEFT